MKKLHPNHGTRNEYARYGCRCEICCEAQRVYQVAYSAKQKKLRESDPKLMEKYRKQRYAIDARQRAKHADRNRASSAAWRARNADKVKQQQKVRFQRFKLKQYGVTESTYKALIEKQSGLCAICGIRDNRSLSIDHDHTTNAVRGLLCRRCNLGLGCFQDNTDNLSKAITYLSGDTIS